MKEGIEKAARGEIFTTEVRMEREGTPTAYLDVSVQPVKDEGGKIIYLLFEARDITELKAAQEQLRQSQKMGRSASSRAALLTTSTICSR
jgi:PAS domain S-box-containing protein